MQLYRMTERNLDETEENTWKHFNYYFNDGKCFALIGDHVVAELSNDHSGNLEALKQEALDHMAQLLNSPPDFATYVMDDYYGLVVMNYGIYAVSTDPLSQEEIASGKVNLATALIMRSSCLDACEAGKIIAVNDVR